MTNSRRPWALIPLLATALLVAGCASTPEGSGSGPTPPASAPAAPLPTLPVATATYDLGRETLVQPSQPAGSRFTEMPVQLNGVVAAPTEGGPYPVVTILHGTHPGCPVDANGVDSWPCDAADEQPNYAGFEWLAQQVAARGYVAVVPNINAEYTLGFGEVTPGVRLEQLVDRHLSALSEAAAGGEADFGIELAGRADLDQLALVGHSRGGESAVALARDWAANADAPGSFGPVDGLLLLAPAVVFQPTEGGVPAPTAIVLPSCDADVVGQDGKGFLESTRLSDNDQWVTSLWLEGANHNNVNTELGPDAFALEGRPDCDTPLAADEQRSVVGDYAVDFLTAVFSDDAGQVGAALAAMGLDPATPPTGTLYGQPAQSALLLPDSARLPLLTPTSADTLATGEAGVTIRTEGVDLAYCPEGYYTPQMLPEAAACRRAQLTVPGEPAHAIISWDHQPAQLGLSLPADVQDLSGYGALSMRVGVDPLSALNPAWQSQQLAIRLTDASGATATVKVGPDQPALRYPAGLTEDDEYFEGDRFTGRLPLLPVRVPLAQFAGVDLATITDVALVFDQTPSGSLFVADLQVVGPVPTPST